MHPLSENVRESRGHAGMQKNWWLTGTSCTKTPREHPPQRAPSWPALVGNSRSERQKGATASRALGAHSDPLGCRPNARKQIELLNSSMKTTSYALLLLALCSGDAWLG